MSSHLYARLTSTLVSDDHIGGMSRFLRDETGAAGSGRHVRYPSVVVLAITAGNVNGSRLSGGARLVPVVSVGAAILLHPGFEHVSSALL